MKLHLLRPLFGCLSTTLLLSGAAAAAQPVSITNPGFENPVLADGGSTSTIAGWTNNGATIINPSAAQYASGSPAQGANMASVFSGSAGSGLSQTLAATLQADASYTLTVKVGDPLDAAFDGYTIQLRANGTVLAQDDNTVVITDGAFTTATATYNYNPANSGLVGQPLEIRLLSKGLSSGDVNFDDVQLTVALGNPIASPGGPYNVAFTGSLSLNGSGSLPSEGQTITSYEWDLDNDGDFDEAITGATPASITYAILQSTYSMVIGANTIKLRVTDSSTPTPKTSTVTGTVTLAPPLGCQLGILNLTANGGINPNTGNPWQLGDKYRIAFHTSGTTPTTSNDPEFYNQFVTNQAWTVAALKGAYWRAMVTVNLNSGLTQASSPKRGVRDNTGTSNLTGGHTQGGAGEPVYVVNGTTCIARNNADIWNNWSNPFENFSNPTISLNSAGTGNNVVRRVVGATYANSSDDVHYSPFLTQSGVQPTPPDVVHGANVAAGCNFAGDHNDALGNTTDNVGRSYGASNPNTTGRVWVRFQDNNSAGMALYAISVPLTIVNLVETVAPTLSSINDNRSGSDFILGADTSIVYTVNFSEPMDAETLTVADFELTGTATATITAILGNLSANAVDVVVTPTAVGTLQLQIKSGAVIEDARANLLNTSSALPDDTTINVINEITPPTLVSITDNVSGGPVNAFIPVTYTVTFSEGINAATLTTADFVNGGTAPVTVNSVAATANPAVFTVVVTPTGAGTLNLQIPVGAVVTDLPGNALVTTSALADDTTITVNPDPLPTLVSIVDNQGGGPVLAGSSFAFTVTFSQPMLSSSVNVTDFDNGGSPALTVNAVAATSNPAVYTVHVTPGGAGTIVLRVAAGATITNLNGTGLDTALPIPDDTTITVNAGSGPARDTITVDGSAFVSANLESLTVTLNASGSDKLVVVVTGENANPGNLSGNSDTVTYDGVALTKVVDRDPIAGDQLFNDIWYLDNPATSTGSIVATLNAFTRGSVTAFALSGTAPGVGQTAISAQASKSVVLSTTFANSIVIASHGMGGDGNSANVTVVDAVLPLIERTATSQASGVPLPWDGHVTATALVPTPGTASYAFTGGNTVGSHTIAVEFFAAASTAPTYASWINGFFPGETNPLIVGALADPDNDGISNAMEMILGGNPATVMDSALLPTLALVTDPAGVPAGQYFLFTYRRTDLSVAAGVTSECEVDTDLVGPWTPAASAPGTVILVDDDFTFSPPSAGTTDRVRVYVPRGTNTRYFGRVKGIVP